MVKFLMLSSYDDLLDYTSHQGFVIDESVKQRVIGYVKAEIASQAHSYDYHDDERVDAVMASADDIEFDGLAFSFDCCFLSVNISAKVECLM